MLLTIIVFFYRTAYVKTKALEEKNELRKCSLKTLSIENRDNAQPNCLEGS